MSILSEREKRQYNYIMLLLIFLLLTFLGARKILGISTSVFHDEEGNKLEIKQSPDYLRSRDGD